MPKIKTIKVLFQDGEIKFLYHGGLLRSHILYIPSDKIATVNFKHQNYTDNGLELVKTQLDRTANVGIKEVSIIDLIVDTESKFVGEIVSEEKGEHLTAEILESELEDKYPHNPINFIYKSSQVDKYITVFNETNDCWMEEFKTLDAAILYMIGETDAEGIKQ